MRRLVLAAIAATAALAMSCAAAADFYGAYVGGKLGFNRSGTSVTSRDGSTTYGLEGGYGWEVGGTALGVNAFYDANQQTTHTPLAQYGSRMYGLGLKLGIPVESLMPYAKLGFGRTQGTGSLANFNANSAHSGVGIEYKLAPNWSIAGEWSAASPSMNGLRLDEDNFTFGMNYYFAPPKNTPAAPAPTDKTK